MQGIFNTLLFSVITIIGMLNFKLIRFNLKKKKTEAKGEIFKPSLRYWIDDNILDFAAAFIVSASIYNFLEEILIIPISFIKIPVFANKMFYGYLLGFLFQLITHKLFNNVKISKL